jgi:hypothetical protein
MDVELYPRFAVITDDDKDPLDICDNCKREWKREMLCEVKDYFQRVEPGGVVPSGECPRCGALCYPKSEQIEEREQRARRWFQEAVWIYPKEDEKFLELLKTNLKDHFGEHCRVWQNSNVGNKEYPQLLCSTDLRGYGEDVVHMWRDGQTWWPISGDYSLKDEEMAEVILRKTIIDYREGSR